MSKFNNIEIYEDIKFCLTDGKGNHKLNQQGEVMLFEKIGGVDITIDFDKDQLISLNDN